MITRRFILTGAVAAPAVIAFNKLMPVRSIVKRYATVWGVGHDLEVIEHVVWDQKDALGFARPWGPIEKFREITDVVYEFDIPPLSPPVISHWTERSDIRTPHNLLDKNVVVRENGFTNVVTFSQQNAWRESLRPDLNGRLSVEWVQEQIAKAREAGIDPLHT